MNAMDHVSVLAVSMMDTVSWLAKFHTRMIESSALAAATSPLELTATDTTPKVCPRYVCTDFS